MVRASNRYLEGHGFDSRRGLRKFFFWVFRLENASSLFTLIQVTNPFIIYENIIDNVVYTSLILSELACVAGGISRASAFVLEAKPWTRVAKPWEDWWRVQLNSRLPKFVGFFELCVHKCTRISDWLRVPTRQSNVNLYLSSFPGAFPLQPTSSNVPDRLL